MKIKAPQILGGIAALSFIFSNLLYVVNWFIEGYGTPSWSLGFWFWPISFVFEVVALTIFTFLFRNNLMRYVAVGIYILMRLIYSLYWMNSYEESIAYFAKVFVAWPYWGGFGLTFISAVFEFLSLILFVIAFILSFMYLSQATNPAPGYSGNRTAPTVTHTPPTQAKKVQGAYGDIEVLGDLLKKGLLTQEEFDLKKREILGLDK